MQFTSKDQAGIFLNNAAGGFRIDINNEAALA